MRWVDSKDRKYRVAILSATSRDGSTRPAPGPEINLLGRPVLMFLAIDLHFWRRSPICATKGSVSVSVEASLRMNLAVQGNDGFELAKTLASRPQSGYRFISCFILLEQYQASDSILDSRFV